MRIVNKTKNRVIAEEVGIAKTFSEKAIGLIKAGAPTALFFETRFGIHTFGMSFPIDCVVLDSQFKVCAMRENILPRHFFFWNPRYKNVIELPAGTLRRLGIEICDVLALE